MGRGEGEELVYGRLERTHVPLNLSEKKFSLERSDGGGSENMKSMRTIGGVWVVRLGPKKGRNIGSFRLVPNGKVERITGLIREFSRGSEYRNYVVTLERRRVPATVKVLYYVLMRTTLRKAREASGVSMKELARRLGVTVPSVSSLELNDENGSAKPQTVDRALEALGLARWDVILPAEVLSGIVRDARASIGRVRWTMALEAQNISDDAVDELVSRSVARRVAALR